MTGDISASRMVGWLLRSNRRLTDADPALRSGKEFARLFGHPGGPPLAPSQITRWEQGETSASRAVIRRYEHMLALAPDSLVTICDALSRAGPARTGTWHSAG